jgi:hypothetical protein
MWIAVVVFCLLLVALSAFIWIARKGRELRRNQPLPPEASHAFLQSSAWPNREVVAPFYFGRSTESNIVLPAAKAEYEACIFYHNHRFAIQSLPGAAILLLNEEEIQAGYLRDGDVLEIRKEKFVFRCY